MVCKAAGVPDEPQDAPQASPQGARRVPTKSEAIATVKATLPNIKTKDDLLKLWDLYPLYQLDVEFKQLFADRKRELGIA